jgi:hypothetical protein
MTALFALLGFNPNPSRMIRTDGLRGTVLAPGIDFPKIQFVVKKCI